MQCRELLSQNYPLLPLQKLKKEWNTKCVNKETLSGYQVYLFPNLKKEGKHCFRPDEMHFFTTNPYTNKKHKMSKTERLNEQTVPIIQTYNKNLCPVERQLEIAMNEDYIFISSPTPCDTVKDLPDTIMIKSTIKTDDATICATRTIKPSNISSRYYYLAKLNKKIEDYISVIKQTNIKRISPLYSKQVAKTLVEKLKDKNLIKELKDYFYYRSQKFSNKCLTLLEQLSIKLPEPIKVYRGMLIHNLEELVTLGLDHLKVGSKITTASRSLPVSWSTDSCLSQYFATSTPAKALKDKSPLQFGILYSTRLHPRQIAIDTRMIDRNFFKKELYVYDQQEVITFPLQKDGTTEEFDCVVERLFLVDVYLKKSVVVKSFNKIISLLQQDAMTIL